MNDASPISYDQVPYPGLSYSQSHPDRLATIATLLGMDPPPVQGCRVLELGCATGANLIPMAQSLPESQFVGIDASARQIADGRATVDALDLKNVALKHTDILDIDVSLGQFDYIIAHGVYSWVSPKVQDKVLEVCKQNLTPNGVAYVSYNTYPGWHMLGTIREMMLYHTRHVTEPQARAAQARAFLGFLADSIPADSTPHGHFLHSYASYVRERLMPKEDGFLLHDELSEINIPLYFYQFAERAAHHGLQYLADAQFRTMLATNFPAEVAQALGRMAQDTIALEQYMDFLRNRTFRQTLLCHRDVRLKSQLNPERLASFYVASPALPESAQPDVRTVSVEKFRAHDGSVLTTDHPVTKAAMLCLTQIWPQAMPFDALLDAARARLNGAQPGAVLPNAPDDAQVLGSNLLQAYGYSNNLVELHVYAPRFVIEPSKQPVASATARLQAQRGAQITNMRHERVNLDEINYQLLSHLDGSRDREALLDTLKKLLTRGSMGVDQPKSDEASLSKMLDARLHQLARAALLVG